MDVVINRCYGGFSISREAFEALLARGSKEAMNVKAETLANYEQFNAYYLFENDRANPDLVAVVKELGQRASSKVAELTIVTIPDDVEYTIEECDGFEHVAEKHRTWYG